MTDLETRLKTWTDAATNGVAPVTIGELQVASPRGRRTKGGLIAAGVVAVTAAVAVFVSSGDDGTVVTDQPPSSAPSTQATAPSSGDANYDTAALRADLGPGVTSTILGTNPGPTSLLDTTPAVLCLANHVVRVFEYPSAGERAALSDRISRDGSQVPAGGGIAIPEWIAPPHFWARGRIIVLYLGPQDDVVAQLEAVLGPTLSPDATAGRGDGLEPETC
jgi:hypothetical protein